jgi:tetratricopeptide (TPR) repeat protein
MYLDARDIDSAFHYGELAIEKKPYVPLAYITVAQTHMLRREKDSAIAVLQRGLRMCGNQFLYGEYLLAGTSLERGDLDSAESRYRSIVKRLERFPQPEPESEFHYSVENKMGIDRQTLRARALYGIGHVFVLRNNLDSASTYFRNATEMSPGYSDAWVDLGVSLLRSRRFDEAETAFREALKFRPDDFTVWYDYGTLLGTTNRLVEARGAFEKSLALCPDFVPAKEKLAVTLKLLENLPSHDRHR